MRGIDEASFLEHFCRPGGRLCLRLYFVLKYPVNTDDTVLYEQIATNWLKHHVYAMDVAERLRRLICACRAIRHFSQSSTPSPAARRHAREW